MRVIPVLLTLVWVGLVIWFAPIALLFALPWIAATILVARRAGWGVFGRKGGPDRSQNEQLRSFGGR